MPCFTMNHDIVTVHYRVAGMWRMGEELGRRSPESTLCGVSEEVCRIPRTPRVCCQGNLLD